MRRGVVTVMKPLRSVVKKPEPLSRALIVAALGPVTRCDEVGQAAAGAVQAGFRVFGALGLLAQAVPGEQHAIAVFVGVEGDVVVVHAVGGPKAHHGISGQPAAFESP